MVAMSDIEHRHVVVVDDTASFRKFVVRVLEGQHFRVSAAGDFASAIDLIEREDRIDLLIADLALGPDSPHGVSLCNMAQLRRRRLKVILMSGSFDVQHAAQYVNTAGCCKSRLPRGS
jgi:two-component system, cell cycle sensor histidine kinase and response regulator CckA